MTTKTSTVLNPTAAQSTCSQQQDSDSYQKTNQVFQRCLDLLLLVGYAIEYAIHWVGSINPWTSGRVFVYPGQVLCKSSGFAKFSDLLKYIQYRHHPYSFKGKEEIFTKRGLTPQKTEFTPRPFSPGNCFGNSVALIQKWFESDEDIDEVIPVFEGGSSLLGAIYQEAYREGLGNPSYHDEFSARMIDVIDNVGTISFTDEKNMWQGMIAGSYAKAAKAHPEITKKEWALSQQKDQEVLIAMLDALASYLTDRLHPQNGDFIQEMKKRCPIELIDTMLATVRHVAQHYVNGPRLVDQDRMQAFFELADLNVESFIHMNRSPSDVLRSLLNLGSGAYKLSLPVHGPFGNIVDYHSIACVIGPTACYIFDDGIALGSCPQGEDLQKTMGRLFTEYNGMDYSKGIDGEFPSWAVRIGNVFRERSNPPATRPTSGYDLYKIAPLRR